jgi:glycosyltransferase involved in cell wall biosynthesis
MKILLIAYEFPPAISPQSIRWAYLVRELMLAGHEIHVLAPDNHLVTPDLMDLVAGAVVHRTFPGLFAGFIGGGGRWFASNSPSLTVPPDDAIASLSRTSARLNWRGRISESAKAVARHVFFPDVRGEWNPWARRKLSLLLDSVEPDVVISSHEPASTIELGRLAHEQGYPWIVDMGDPVLSSYTPSRWRRRALQVERMAAREAEGLLVTSESTRALLQSRHGNGLAACHIITQGFDDRLAEDSLALVQHLFDPARLELLYTGRLYSFRRIDCLLDVLLTEPSIRLTVVTTQAPTSLLDAAAKMPGQVRVLGPLAHRAVLSLQRCCDVLVNIANDDPVQIPGKFYEYLGSGKPILHLRKKERDAASDLLESSGQGSFVVAAGEQLRQKLSELVARKRGQLPLGSPASGLARDSYTWRALAARVAVVCGEAAKLRHTDESP